MSQEFRIVRQAERTKNLVESNFLTLDDVSDLDWSLAENFWGLENAIKLEREQAKNSIQELVNKNK